MPHARLLPAFTFTDDRLAQLRAVAPEAFTAGRVNWDLLREALGDYLEDEGPTTEHFGLSWPGKREAGRLAARPSAGTLVPVPDESQDDRTTRNVFIEGDNLEVLKLLQKSYADRVKMIYIDPPYNTGNEFVYSDDFREPVDSYLKRTGQTGAKGQALTTNAKSDGRFHSNWLSMMYPRLLVARRLLHADGLIFVTIDDNEVAHLRMLMDEVFGPENFLASIAWEKRFTRSNNAKLFYSLKDMVFVYRKSGSIAALREPRTHKSDSIYRNPDNDPRGPWTSSSYVNPATKSARPNLVYPLRNPITGDTIEHPTHAWKYARVEHERHVREKRLWWGRDGDARYPRLKVFLSDSQASGLVPVDLWDHKTTGTTDEGGAELKQLFGAAVFDNPKPTRLIRRMLRLATEPADGDIVMDFFAGSCSTGHAVFALNAEDGGNRRFIMVQLPEPTPPSSTANGCGYHDVAAIGKERLRRAAAKIGATPPPQLPPAAERGSVDLGFKVFSLSPSQLRPWSDEPVKDVQQAQARFDEPADPLAEGWQPLPLLTELMLLAGFPLDSTVTVDARFSANRVTCVASDAFVHRLFVCLDGDMHQETVAALYLDDADVFICREIALSEDQKRFLGSVVNLKTI
jgi:adenine-specific DNA-methyltransferase